MKVVLFQPQIPQNTGNIVRTCAAAGVGLILIEPFGFTINSRWLKRASLDYWNDVDIEMTNDLDLVLEKHPSAYFLSSKASRPYWDVSFKQEDLLIFGSETAGLPSHYLEKYPDRFVTIPMENTTRCLNLATSVGIVLYEAKRQLIMPA